jgi:hypothetical protein
MDLRNGFTIDNPPVAVPWSTSEAQLQNLFGSLLRHVTDGYWVAKVDVLGGLRCNLGFHFHQRPGVLTELEFFRDSYADQSASFEEFQRYFEAVFGAPVSRKPGTEGFPECRWVVPGAEIVHYVFDRFGPEEHMRIRRRR